MRDMTNTQRIFAALGKFWSGKRVGIISPSFNRSAIALAQQVGSFGARVDVFVGAISQEGGVGSDWHTWFAFGSAAKRTSRTSFELLLASKPTSFGQWLDEIDPDGTLILLGGVFTEVPEFFGRQVHGWRRPEWGMWEDKTRIDALFAKASVPIPPHALIDIEASVSADEFSSLDAGNGFIVAMDSSEGYVGDAKGLRWIGLAADLPNCIESLRGRSRRFRIAPFLEGIPCSTLGIVLEDGVAVFDPIEVVTLRNYCANKLLFCGTSNHWRPPPDAAHSMREATRRAGIELASCSGYRGFYSMDGLLTDNGFLATELNPRHASGLGLNFAANWFPDYLFQRAVQEGIDDVWSTPSMWIETEFRKVIASYPSFRIGWKVDDVIDDERVAIQGIGGVRYRVAYKVVGGVLNIDSVHPVPNLLGPVVSALARQLTHSNWRSANEANSSVMVGSAK